MIRAAYEPISPYEPLTHHDVKSERLGDILVEMIITWAKVNTDIQTFEWHHSLFSAFAKLILQCNVTNDDLRRLGTEVQTQSNGAITAEFKESKGWFHPRNLIFTKN